MCNQSMQYSLSDRLCMTLDLLKQTQASSIIQNFSADAEIIHRSLWAVSVKDREYVYKFFYYDDAVKINREIELLNLMGQICVELTTDSSTNLICSKTKYLSLEKIDDNCSLEWIYSQLRYYFDWWKRDQRFLQCVSDSWETETVPYMVNMLELFLPESQIYVQYLKNTFAEQFIHGDFTLSNVKKYRDEIFIYDFELATKGPELWDETNFVYSLIEKRYYAHAQKLFERFGCSSNMLNCIAAVKLAVANKKSVNGIKRQDAFNYIINEFGGMTI